ncbi:MAG: riboflavin synthase [Flavobacteriaceae bacterium]
MFTGIIETLGEIVQLEKNQSNLDLWVKSKITSELKIDQSVAHNGVCLTVVDIDKDIYKVTAIEETLQKTNLNHLKQGDFVNLERAMLMNARLDGHMVQGHVDTTAVCSHVSNQDGSWEFRFQFEDVPEFITVEKGSITVDGVSLTVVDSMEKEFSVAIIPYTYEHTRFQGYQPSDVVNIEFDVIGKYIHKILKQQGKI